MRSEIPVWVLFLGERREKILVIEEDGVRASIIMDKEGNEVVLNHSDVIKLCILDLKIHAVMFTMNRKFEVWVESRNVAPTTKELKIDKVWQPVTQDNDGTNIPSYSFFTTEEEAKKRCNGWGAAPDPISRDAVLLEDGKVWLLEKSPVDLYHSSEDMQKKQALAKLTAQERKLLGL